MISNDSKGADHHMHDAGECGPLPVKPPTNSEAARYSAESFGQSTGECGLLPCKLPTVTREEPAGAGTDQGGHAIVPPDMQRCPSQCPLIFLDGSSLLKMGCTYPCDDSMVQSFRTQTITIADRRPVLDNQGPIWADDELRWHIQDLVTCAGQWAPAEANGGPLVAIDPLLFDGWTFAGTDSCEGWFQNHCPGQATIVTVACIQAHWIPVVMVPHQQGFLVHTWDDRASDHSLLEPVFAKVAECMGLGAHGTARPVRMFDMSQGCGAMAVAYIAHMLLDSMLPVNPSEVVQLHQVLRQGFVAHAEPSDADMHKTMEVGQWFAAPG